MRSHLLETIFADPIQEAHVNPEGRARGPSFWTRESPPRLGWAAFVGAAVAILRVAANLSIPVLDCLSRVDTVLHNTILHTAWAWASSLPSAITIWFLGLLTLVRARAIERGKDADMQTGRRCATARLHPCWTGALEDVVAARSIAVVDSFYDETPRLRELLRESLRQHPYARISLQIFVLDPGSSFGPQRLYESRSNTGSSTSARRDMTPNDFKKEYRREIAHCISALRGLGRDFSNVLIDIWGYKLTLSRRCIVIDDHYFVVGWFLPGEVNPASACLSFSVSDDPNDMSHVNSVRLQLAELESDNLRLLYSNHRPDESAA